MRLTTDLSVSGLEVKSGNVYKGQSYIEGFMCTSAEK